MPRTARRVSSSGFYHVTARSVGRQALFEDDSDREAFLDMLDQQLAKHEMVLRAWCLMDNHVHLLLEDAGGHLSEAMHDLMARYAQRFNRKSGHVGHVFQDRFGSEPVEGDAHLLETVRYIHNNPEVGGICPRAEYPWSSYGEYVGSPRRSDTSLVLGMLDGVEGFVEFSGARGSPYMHMRRKRVPDAEARELALATLGGGEPARIKALPKVERNRCLGDLRSVGLSVRQIERLTGIGRWTITNATT